MQNMRWMRRMKREEGRVIIRWGGGWLSLFGVPILVATYFVVAYFVQIGGFFIVAAFFFGILYSSFGFVDTGTTEIHGMVIAKGIATLSGSRNVVYDPNVLANLNLIVPANVRMMPNTWRELQPQ